MTPDRVAALVMAAIGFAIMIAIRPLFAFQIRMAEWQLNQMRKHTAAYIIAFRVIGVIFVVGAISIFFQH